MLKQSAAKYIRHRVELLPAVGIACVSMCGRLYYILLINSSIGQTLRGGSSYVPVQVSSLGRVGDSYRRDFFFRVIRGRHSAREVAVGKMRRRGPLRRLRAPWRRL